MELLSLKQRFGILGNSFGLNRALNVAVRVAPTNLSVLILGESGVGKEVFSQIIHNLSPRKHNKFIAVNCGAIPEGTIDSELFGHEKGAFTGAHDNRKGYFEVVNGGTIFLDEIGEMPIGTQSRLLRILESGEFIKVGSSKTQKTDVRIIAATNVNLMEAVRRGKFREDLYYRLNTVPIEIPPLRERQEDIYLLFRKFTSDFAEKNRIRSISLAPDAKDLLINYQWPGNIRELKNIAEQITILSTERFIDAEALIHFLPGASAAGTRFPVLSSRGGYQSDNMYSDREIMYNMLGEMRRDLKEVKYFMMQLFQQQNGTHSLLPQANMATDYHPPQATTTHPLTSVDEPLSSPLVINKTNRFQNKEEAYKPAEIVEESLSLQDMERDFIQKALNKHKGKRKDAALDLGISERTLYRKIKEYNIKE